MNTTYPGFHLWRQEQERSSERIEREPAVLYVELLEDEAEVGSDPGEPDYGTVEIPW